MIQLIGINSPEIKRIKEELDKINANYNFSQVGKVFIRTRTGFVNFNNIDLNKTNVVYLRSAMRFKQLYRQLCSTLNFERVHIVNYRNDFLFGDKVSYTMALTLKGIPVIPTSIFTKNSFETVKKFNWQFPMVVKHPSLHRGTAVYKVNDKTELDEVVDSISSNIILMQPFVKLKITKDYRSIYVGKYLGTMVRKATKEDEFRCNVALGGTALKVTKIKKDKMFEEMTTKIANTLKLDVFAIDYIKYYNTYAVLEINTAFQFKGFEKATDINVAKEIATYLADKDFKHGKYRRGIVNGYK